MAYVPDLSRLLTAGAEYSDAQATYRIEVHAVDEVVLPSGQVVGCDPLVKADAAPFTVTVEPGRFPLRAWVAVLYRDGVEWQRRVVALQLGDTG